MHRRGPTKNLQREHHYLPECYQRGFADDSGRVWIKDANKIEPEHRKTKNIGKRRNFYIRNVNGVEDDQIEKFFCKEVEDGFGLVSQKIRREGPKVTLSGTELGFLTRFIATQVVRTMAHKHCVDEQAGQSVDRDTYLRVMCRQVATIMAAWGKDLPSFYFLTPLPIVTHGFITGDNPVLVLNTSTSTISAPPTTPPAKTITDLSEILSNAESHFVTTLSPYMAVVLRQQRSNSVRVQINTIDPIGVLRVNRLIRGQSQIFALARDKESL